ncbi:hypothetical protein ASF08_13155 [Methylobacterium sp. Leaf85]|nr:hypothetical protein ASF08_13155 [Methylobacterium sp. Leaf85]
MSTSALLLSRQLLGWPRASVGLLPHRLLAEDGLPDLFAIVLNGPAADPVERWRDRQALAPGQPYANDPFSRLGCSIDQRRDLGISNALRAERDDNDVRSRQACLEITQLDAIRADKRPAEGFDKISQRADLRFSARNRADENAVAFHVDWHC